MSLMEFDKEYVKSLKATSDLLEKSFKTIKDNYQFDLVKTEISEAILERLKMYYLSQGKVKTFLDKRYIAPASDFFVESVLFFLKLYFINQGEGLDAHSERQIRRTKNSIRPDISIWKGDDVIAIIECKTQLGWNRDNWEKHHVEREVKLQKEFPNAQSYLLVMTGSNWGGFGNHELLNHKYFCLLDSMWPTEFKSADDILTPIEGLFKQF